MRRFRQLVTFQAPVKTRTPAGQVIEDSYENVTGLVDLPATVVAVTEEDRQDQRIVIEGRFDIVVAGHRPEIETGMVVLDGEAVYDVLSTARTIGRRSTVVTAHLVAI